MPTTAHLLTSDPLREEVRNLALDWSASYLLNGRGWWWHFEPLIDRPFRRQGWKLHVSAEPATATRTLRLVADIVMARGLRWKVIKSIHQLTVLCTPPVPISQVGKFITIYLEDDDSVVDLAEELHTATRFYDGPVVPSDQRYRRGSNVYLRYGGFDLTVTYAGPEQFRAGILVGPEGQQAEDRRAPGHVAPPWITELPVPVEPPVARQGSGLFGRGIEVLDGFRQSARGGVYRAMWNGEQVVVKEARIGTCTDLLGRDSRDRLLNEWKILRRLKGTGLAPDPLDFFFEENNAYLVEEFVPGSTLRSIVESTNYRGVPSTEDLLSIWRQLPDLVAQARSHGVWLRDLSPNNIMVDDGRCVLIDLELSNLAGSTDPPFGGWTPGYGLADDKARSPENVVELALAGVAHFVLTGIDPYIGRSESYASHVNQVLTEFVSTDGGNDAAELCRIRSRLAADVPDVDRDQILTDAVAAGEELTACVEWDREPWPWPEKWAPGSFHPASFTNGTLGIVRYYLDLWQATNDRAWIRHAGDLLAWTYDKFTFVPGQCPPGLHLGVGAMPWLMAELATLDDDMSVLWRRRAGELAAELSTAPFDFSDITHGRAGIGLMNLAVLHLVGDDGSREAAHRIARDLIQDAADEEGLPVWPWGDHSYFGFAHGSAGIGYFLLAAGRLLSDESAMDLSAELGRALVGVAEPAAGGKGLTWPHWHGSSTRWTHWCNGAAGIGAFLLPLWAATGDEVVLDTAVKAGRTIALGRPFGTCCRCHGLAGDGDLLLDLADHTMDFSYGEEFRAGAVRLGRKLDALKVVRNSVAVWPHEGDGEPRPGFMLGYTGIHSFRLRLAGLLDHSPLMLPYSILGRP